MDFGLEFSDRLLGHGSDQAMFGQTPAQPNRGFFCRAKIRRRHLPRPRRVVSDRTTPKRLAPAAFFFIHAGNSEPWTFVRCAVSHRFSSVVRVHTLVDNCPRMTAFDGQTLMLENAAKTRAGTAPARFSVPDLLHLDSPCRRSKTHGAT